MTQKKCYEVQRQMTRISFKSFERYYAVGSNSKSSDLSMSSRLQNVQFADTLDNSTII